jgi:hypothetical protein
LENTIITKSESKVQAVRLESLEHHGRFRSQILTRISNRLNGSIGIRETTLRRVWEWRAVSSNANKTGNLTLREEADCLVQDVIDQVGLMVARFGGLLGN